MAVNADVNINIGVKSTKRDHFEPFKPTSIRTEAFHYTTDLDSYPALVDTISTNVFSHVEEQRLLGWQTTTLYSVRLDNPTHPATGAGVVKLAKGHLDGSLSDEEFQSSLNLKNTLSTIIGDLKTRAKY